MGYYDGSTLPLWPLAKDYVLADNFFMGAFGGSYLNHFWLICACTPEDRKAPASLFAQIDSRGWLKTKSDSPASVLDGAPIFLDGDVTPDGYSVNTTQPPWQPSRVPPAKDGDPRATDPKQHTLPPQTMTTIGDTLTAKDVSWAWYSGAWDAALKDGMQPPDAPRKVIATYGKRRAVLRHPSPAVQLFRAFCAGTVDRERHLKDYTDLEADIAKGSLPQVSFYKPQGTLNEHPGYANVLSGDQHIADLVAKIKASSLWRPRRSSSPTTKTAASGTTSRRPPANAGDPGTRIPTIIISPLAKRGFIDHTPYDTTSILKLITLRFGLAPLPGVRAGAGDLTAAFE